MFSVLFRFASFLPAGRLAVYAASLLFLPLPMAAVGISDLPDKWALYCKQANAASRKKDFAAAEHYLKLALAESKQFAPSDPRIADTLEELGNTFMSERKWSEAEDSYKLCLRLREDSLGPKNARVAMILQRMGDLYSRKNEFSAAASCYSRETTILAGIYGPDHRYLSFPYLKMAKAYEGEKLYDWAENAAKNALGVRQLHIGSDNPYLVEELGILGEISIQRNKLDEAENYLKRAVSLAESGLRSTDVAQLQPMKALAALYMSEGKSDLAQPLLQKAESIAARNKDYCLAAIDILSNEVFSEIKMKDFDKADKTYQRLESLARSCPKYNPNEFRLLTDKIGMQLFNLQQAARAEKYLLAGLAMDPDRQDDGQPGLLGALGVCQNLRGDVAASRQTFEKMYKVSTKFPGQDNLVRAAAANALAGTCFQLNKLSEAERYYREATDIFLKRPDFYLSKASFKSYSDLLTRLGKKSEAAKYLQLSSSK